MILLYTRTTERKFKRHVLSPDAGPLKSGFFIYKGVLMEIFIYSDESGVFDADHHRYYVFGGVMFLGRKAADNAARQYIHAENTVRTALSFPVGEELKASSITYKYRGKLFRSLNNQIRFGVVVDEKKVLSQIWKSKKDKQRYLDYVYKIAVKRCFEFLIRKGRLNPSDVRQLHFYVDEHTTATNGRYELEEALEQEFKHGTYNSAYDRFFPPIFPNMEHVEVVFCNSSTVTLVRAADIIANRIYREALANDKYHAEEDDLFVIRQP